MKLAAIYNVWDGIEFLEGSMNCIAKHVDVIILVVQKISNVGEYYNPIPDLPNTKFKYVVLSYSPDLGKPASYNEIQKRQLGIDHAKFMGCTHFISMDCDEYYEDFGLAKQEYLNLNPSGGSVCKMFTYFKKPVLRFEQEDNYYVPFIHKLMPDTLTGVSQYPFYVDPTRRVNTTKVVELPGVRMHHFSWVRKNIERKAMNSTARHNIAKSKLLRDYYSDCGPGSYIEDFRQKLIEVPNKFNIEI